MGEREIRAKYGGHLPKAINRAIRAEVHGGNEALDRLTHLAGAARHSHWHDAKGRPTPEAEAYYRHQRDVIGPMDATVRKRWGVPPDAEPRGADDPPGTRRGGQRAAKSGPMRGSRPVAAARATRKRGLGRGGKPATRHQG